jgi:prepilin-type N-terminal cleavage/methylation domain-containing protein
MSDRWAPIGVTCAQRYRRLGAGKSGASPKAKAVQDGVSLVELLVVMAILALVAAVALPARAPERGPSLAVLAADIAGKLRAARALAVAQARDVAFAFDVEARTYVVEGTGAPQTLPHATDLSITTARQFVRDA